MQEKTKKMLFAIVLGLVIGLGLLVGISAVVSQAIEPLTERMVVLTAGQTRLEQKIVELDKGIKALAVSAPSKMPPPAPPEDLTIYDIPVGRSAVLGNLNAPVTIVEFSDLQCPFCARFHAPLMEAMQAFPGQVRLMFKNFPLNFHPNARPAAKAALAAGVQGKYFEMIALIMKDQANMTPEKYNEYATQLGLNMEQFAKDLQEGDGILDSWIREEQELGVKVNVQGTPTYFLNGKKTKARSVDEWKKAIAELLKDGKSE